MNWASRLRVSLLLAGITVTAHAQTIYPLNRAEILAGAKFDFKVEFPGAPAETDVKVIVNGKDAARVLGGERRFIQNEDGQDLSALWLRNAAITVPGAYTVEVSSGGNTAQVAWKVCGTRDRAARNVILFIGDGMTIAHRTAARMLSKGIVEGRYGGELAIDDMPHMALLSTAGTDSIVTDSVNSMSAYTTVISPASTHWRSIAPATKTRWSIQRSRPSANP
jgi:alkaline phosphatase